MTIEQITKEVNRVKVVSRRQIVRYLSAFEISPAGRRQRPQVYPDDAAVRIITELGLGVVTLNTMRAARRKSQKARAA